jgi:hypothetical protein
MQGSNAVSITSGLVRVLISGVNPKMRTCGFSTRRLRTINSRASARMMHPESFAHQDVQGVTFQREYVLPDQSNGISFLGSVYANYLFIDKRTRDFAVQKAFRRLVDAILRLEKWPDPAACFLSR